MSHPARPSSGLAQCLLPHPEPLARPGRSTLPRPTPPAERRAGQCAPWPSLGRDHVVFLSSLPTGWHQGTGRARALTGPSGVQIRGPE